MQSMITWPLAFLVLGSVVMLPCFGGSAGQSAQVDTPSVIWSARPVVLAGSAAAQLRYADTYWSQNVFPMGNGRLGFTVFGDPDRERLQFNEDSLWVGNEDHTGGYQPFGDLYIDLGHKSYSDYRRELDIGRAMQTVTYKSGDVAYTREYFASYPAQVCVFRFTASKPGAFSGSAWLDSMHRSEFAKAQDHDPKSMQAIVTTAKDRTLTLKGESKDLFWWPQVIRKGLRGREYVSDKIINLHYEARVRVINDGGSVKTDGDRVVFEKCNSLTFLLAADTDYLNRRDQGWRTEHPHERLAGQIAGAAARDYGQLVDEHVRDYRGLYDRFSIKLGATDADRRSVATAERVASYEPGNDPELEALMYQYARYLMISCSRPGHGGLPANLQGLWLFHLRPAWLCDYHTDINLQMNYWFVDQANLAECFVPLAEWLDSIRDVRKEETRKVLGAERGWLMRSENGIFGGSTYYFQKGDSAWICQNLWDHYAFTQDREYLKRYAYPIMKEISEFWVDHLKELPDGTLVVPDGTSPEHGPQVAKDGSVKIVEGLRTHLDGVSYDQQLCWDLFSNTIEASQALGVDADFRAELQKKRARLLGPRIGRWGQLQEWMEDVDDPKDQHRHVSHMIAVYPGRQIHPSTTPKLAEAAKVSVLARGNGRTGWSKVFKACVFARLLDAEDAYRLLSDVIQTKTHGNLWTTHPPFQIDCNFGYAAAVNEMLVQSHMGEIHLLPALPKAWADGEVKGMRLRGGFGLDMQWKNGALVTAKISNLSSETGKCAVRYAGKVREIEVTPKAPVVLDESGSAANAAETPHVAMPLTESLAPYTGPIVKPKDNTTINGKVMCGYQGWFMARGDGYEPGFVHWGGMDQEPPTCTVDLWPDMSEYDEDERFPTNYRHRDGSTAFVFSSTVKKTVLRHFEWMKEYGIDGAWIQRFTSPISNQQNWNYQRSCAVLNHCREGANRNGVNYAVMYDTSFDRPAVDVIKADWTRLINEMTLTTTPAYIRHRGAPVVSLWGYGFAHRTFEAAAAEDLFTFFKRPENGGCTIMLGVPNDWVTWKDDRMKLLKQYAHIISPWNVGRYQDVNSAKQHFARHWPSDLAFCKENDKDYYAVVFPGFSWTNLRKGKTPLNQIPRQGGRLFWEQFEEVKRYGMKMAYVAMFDEVDEGTAIFKCTNNPPVGRFCTYEGLPSDHYLRMCGLAGRLLRGEDVRFPDTAPDPAQH